MLSWVCTELDHKRCQIGENIGDALSCTICATFGVQILYNFVSCQNLQENELQI